MVETTIKIKFLKRAFAKRVIEANSVALKKKKELKKTQDKLVKITA